MSPVKLYANVPCKLSQSGMSYTAKLADVKQSNLGILNKRQKIFFMPDVDIQSGDKLKLHRYQYKTLDFYAGEVFHYPSHVEVKVTISEKM